MSSMLHPAADRSSSHLFSLRESCAPPMRNDNANDYCVDHPCSHRPVPVTSLSSSSADAGLRCESGGRAMSSTRAKSRRDESMRLVAVVVVACVFSMLPGIPSFASPGADSESSAKAATDAEPSDQQGAPVEPGGTGGTPPGNPTFRPHHPPPGRPGLGGAIRYRT